MQKEASKIEQTVKPSIKERLLARFTTAVAAIGSDWHRQLGEYNAYYNTQDGVNEFKAVRDSVRDPKRADADRIERVVEALEALLESKQVAA